MTGSRWEAPAAGAVVVVAPVPAPAAADVLSRALPAAEQARAGALGGARRAEFVGGRTLVRAVAGRLLGLSPAAVPLVVTPDGRPELRGPTSGPPLTVSIAHSGARVAVAVGRTGSVGVDIEAVRTPPAGAVRWSCTTAESAALAALPEPARPAAFVQLWTVKEACLKAVGTGIRRRLSGLHVGLGGAGRWAAVRWRAVPPGRGLAAAVALTGPAHADLPVRVHTIRDLETLS